MSLIKSYSVGKGDMFYINHNSDNFTVIDCCYDDDDEKTAIFDEVKEKSSQKGITRFISTHPDDDHIKGLKEFDEKIGIWNFYCVQNNATKTKDTEDFSKYCDLRDGSHHYYLFQGCKRKWMNQNDDERKNSGINCLWPNTSNQKYKDALKEAKEGNSPNNISPILTYSMENGVNVMWMGDIESDFLDEVKDDIEFKKMNILFAPHHGRKSGKISSDILDIIDPDIVIIGEAPSEYLDYYKDYNTITQNSASEIILDCEVHKVHVYVSNKSYSVKFLSDDRKSDTYGKYIGTLNV
jgi:beta-lactamase superfamily II metal-dependent hydrolase